MRKAITLAFALTALMVNSSCATTASNDASDSDPYLTSGEKFGVTIGMDSSRAKAIMESRGQTVYATTNPCANEHFADKCPAGAIVDSFLVSRFSQNGVIFIVSVDQKVVGISWSLNSVPIF